VQVFWGTASTLAVLESARRDALGAERRANELERQLLNAQRVESIGQVASGVAHDFNNVLTVIRQSAQMALDPAVTRREVEQDLREIVAASERGSALTRQLLNFARGAPEDATACDVNGRVQALLPMLQRLASHAVTIDLRLSADAPMARIDGTQFDQLVVNFVTNARDAMPTGGRITISTARVAESPSAPGGARRPVPAALLTVSDQGAGIPEEMQQRIFEPFFTTKAQERGTGLGLTTCASVVRRAGGVIELASSPARGTTFDVYLPLA
jgi:signal transduction histidine kinase